MGGEGGGGARQRCFVSPVAVWGLGLSWGFVVCCVCEGVWRGKGGLHPTPQTLHTYPKSKALSFNPEPLQPKLSNFNLKPYTSIKTPQTQHSKTYTPNLKPPNICASISAPPSPPSNPNNTLFSTSPSVISTGTGLAAVLWFGV